MAPEQGGRVVSSLPLGVAAGMAMIRPTMSTDPFELDDAAPFVPEPFQPAPVYRPVSTPWLDGLNPEQKEAVEATDGPVLVLSGAGTGKTRVLTTRLAHILLTRRALPWRCLAVTFTNKAAREMRERISTLVGAPASQIWLGTFHALGARILRKHAQLVGLTSDFTILDADDQLRLLKQILDAEHIDSKKWPPQMVMGAIQRWKDRGLPPSQIGDDEAGKLANGHAVKIYRTYQDRLKSLNACDFGDLLLHCLYILRDPAQADILAHYQDQFQYILVDEYQDTNIAQYLWLRLLAQKHKNICVVGDDDQSVYSWRGAEVGNILRFERDFPGTKVVRLEANYRSTPAILAAASGLIRHNQGRLGKTLRPGRAEMETGERIVVRGVWDGEGDARWVVEEIETLQRQGFSLGQMAILVRAGFQTREFEERLITTGIPYRVVGGLRFYERQEIRDALAYFRVVVQPADDLAFERIFNVPKRGLGEASLQAVHVLARAQGVPLTEAARQVCESDELPTRAKTNLSHLLADFLRWRALLAITHHTELARSILDQSGYNAMWREARGADAQGRIENLKELVTAMEEFESLPAFLEHVSLVMENDEKTDIERVTLMTLHAAKGLEFDAVFLPGWEEGVFPHQRALEQSGAKGLEEERRLAYVGITRAKKRAYVTYAANRRIYNQRQASLPSRFIEELPEDSIEHHSERGLFGASETDSGWNRSHASSGPPRRPSPVGLTSQTAWPQSAIPAATSAFAAGGRVFHQKFGYGKIVAVDGNKLEIAFDKAGVKKVIDSFVTPA
jgi:DNA helicase-2/ATP-dependent DNA helicase PcrA